MLTEQVQNGLADLFTPGVDLLTYPRGDAAQAAAVAMAALADPDALTAIAASGKRKALAKHTVVSRARQIIDAGELALKATDRRLEHGSMARMPGLLGLDKEG